MEHLQSCRVLLAMNAENIIPDANTNDDYDNMIWLAAHEHFHVWNIKRLRPEGLGPFDYSREVYTPSLWIAEGITTYYSYLSLIRSGVYTTEKFLSELGGKISRIENAPGKRYRSLVELSMLTWLFKGNIPRYEATNMDETTYSYYYKGMVVAFLLDLKIRQHSKNSHSLDDLMRKMWQKYYCTGHSEYFLPGRGYTEAEIEDDLVALGGEGMRSFLKTALYTTENLDYSTLQHAGLELNKSERNRYDLKIRSGRTAGQMALFNSLIQGAR
jgi:predicted metalloprotease with PDZ domain